MCIDLGDRFSDIDCTQDIGDHTSSFGCDMRNTTALFASCSAASPENRDPHRASHHANRHCAWTWQMREEIWKLGERDEIGRDGDVVEMKEMAGEAQFNTRTKA